MTNRVLIVGGGITGLSAAHYLNRAGFRAAVIEKSPRLGGVVRTDRVQDCLLEAGPDSFLASKSAALDLIREVGLADEVIDSNDRLRVVYVVRNGKMIPLPAGMTMMAPSRIVPLLTTRLLTWPAKIRMGLETFRRPGPPREDRSVEAFILDHFGREAVDYLTEPLLAGVFGGDPRLLSANSVLARFVEMETAYGSVSRGVRAIPKKPAGEGSLFRTLSRGLGRLIDRLARDADIVQGEAEAIEPAEHGYRVRVNGDWMEAERIFIGAPAYVAGKLLQPFNGTLADLLTGIPYNSSVTLSLGYDKKTFGPPPNGFGFLVPKLERKRLKACTWVNNKFNFRAEDDKILLRCFFGGDCISINDSDLVQTAQDELQAIMGVEAAPVFSYVARWPQAMAQYNVGHGRRVEQINALMAQLPGIRIGGNGYNGVGIPDCILSGKTAAEAIARAGWR